MTDPQQGWQPRSWTSPHDGADDADWSTPPGTGADPAWQAPPAYSAYPVASGTNLAWGAPPPPPPSSRRNRVWLAVGALVVVVLVVALINGLRGNGRSSTASTNPPLPSASLLPSSPPSGSAGAGGSAGSGGATGGGLPTVSCPTIRDEQSHLSYQCVDNALVQGDSDNYLGLRIALSREVEPNWVISQGSGNPLSLASPPPGNTVGFRQRPTTAPRVVTVADPTASSPAPVATPTAVQVQAEVVRRTQLALVRGYGDAPASKTLAAHVRMFSGVAGYELLTDITINPAYRALQGLKVKTERLWVVGIPTKAGVSIYMLTIPDEAQQLWSKAESTIGTIQII